MRHLLDRQQRAVDKLGHLKVGALFMRPGTGKTQTAVELIRSVNPDYILWLTTFQAIKTENIQAELEVCGGLDCELQGIESLSNSGRLFLELYARLKAARNPAIVCDESLKIKNMTAKRTQRILQLSRLAEYKLVLNGTPVSRNILDLWAQMEFLSPKILKMRQSQFKNNFCEYVTITKQSSRREFITGYRNVEYLHSLISPFIFEAELSLTVGQKQLEHHYKVDGEKRVVYQEIKNKYLNLNMDHPFQFIRMVQELQHSYCCSSEKLLYLEELVKIHGAKNIIVFCKFLDSVAAISDNFPDLTVLTYGKHSHCLNLQQYHVTVFFDKTWDYAQIDQAKRRTYREGQNRDCLYIDLTGNIKLENLIDRNISKKIKMMDYFKQKTTEDLEREL